MKYDREEAKAKKEADRERAATVADLTARAARAARRAGAKDPDDVAQTVMARFAGCEASVEQPERWVAIVARREVIGRHRKDGRLVQPDYELSDPLGKLIFGRGRPARHASFPVRMQDQIDRALDVLGPHDRELLLAATQEDLMPEEIALRFGMTVGAVRTALSRARAKVRAAFPEGPSFT